MHTSSKIKRSRKAYKFQTGYVDGYKDTHWHVWWPTSWKLWVAGQTTTCRGRGI